MKWKRALLTVVWSWGPSWKCQAMAKGFCRKETRLGLDWEMFTRATLGRMELDGGCRQTGL